ncbi:hypothetical protein PIB30_111947, partial [Stylosanthes scabra]|nr:hypothetical protein [Stylosanthes scabra]
MAKGDEVNDFDPSSSSNELQEEYDSLVEEFTKLAKEFSKMKKKNSEFEKQIDGLKEENKTLGKHICEPIIESCNSCKEHLLEIERLNKSLSKLNESSKNLNELLRNQKHVHNKEGIGYNINQPSMSKKNKNARKSIRQPQAYKQPSKAKIVERQKPKPQHGSYSKNSMNAYRQPFRQPSKHSSFRNNDYKAYRPPNRQTYRKLPRMHIPHVTCHYCNEVGHIAP